jgi:DNA-damage-inducible protein D
MYINSHSESDFESIKHINEFGQEFWYARELQKALGYTEWRNFLNAVNKAQITCEVSGFNTSDHFVEVNKMVPLGSGAVRKQVDFELSRYACYLIVQTGDPKKEVIALGQTYFALKTREQELAEKFAELSEDQKRLAVRRELIEHNKSLAEAAQNAGVLEPKDFAIFQNKGYQGLYGGLGVREIHERKGLKKSQKILDYMGSEELAANLFRTTQTDSKLRRDNIQGKTQAGNVHYSVGKKVRETIAELGGTMPENLPTPDKNIGKLSEEQKLPLEMK